MKNVIVVGAGRSGTSLLAGLVSNSNYFIGTDYIKSRDANPKGFFEGREVNRINEQLIAKALPREPKIMRFLRGGNRVPGRGQRWLARVPLSAEVPGDAALEAEIQTLVENAPYCFKDPRFCYTLPIWRRYLENETYLCVFRNPADTVVSILKECASAPYLKGLKLDAAAGFDVWYLMYSRVLRQHAKIGQWMFLNFDQLFDREKLAEIQDRIGSPISFDFPDRQFRRSKGDHTIPAPVAELYDALNEKAGYAPNPKAS